MSKKNDKVEEQKSEEVDPADDNDENKNDDANDKKTYPKLKEQPEEYLRKLDKKDLDVTERINKHYGDKIKMLYPGVIRNFITGYKHFEGKTDKEKDKRFNETTKRIDALLKEYKKYGFDTILDKEFKGEEEMQKAWPIYCFGYDIQGHPVLYDEVASANIPAVKKAFGDGTDTEKLKIYRYRFHRRLANCKRIKSEKHNVLILKHCMVMDMQGFTASHLGGKFRGICREVIGAEQNLFPDTLYRCFVINAGWIFRGMWKIVSNFIDPLTYKKIKVLGGQKDYLKEMTKIIPIDQIPKKYGGKSELKIKSGFCADLPHDRYPLNYYQLKKQENNKKEDDKDKDDEPDDDADDKLPVYNDDKKDKEADTK